MKPLIRKDIMDAIEINKKKYKYMGIEIEGFCDNKVRLPTFDLEVQKDVDMISEFLDLFNDYTLTYSEPSSEIIPELKITNVFFANTERQLRNKFSDNHYLKEFLPAYAGTVAAILIYWNSLEYFLSPALGKDTIDTIVALTWLSSLVPYLKLKFLKERA